MTFERTRYTTSRAEWRRSLATSVAIASFGLVVLVGPIYAQIVPATNTSAHWEKGSDWRRAEAKLTALPEFVTTIDGEQHFDRSGN